MGYKVHGTGRAQQGVHAHEGVRAVRCGGGRRRGAAGSGRPQAARACACCTPIAKPGQPPTTCPQPPPQPQNFHNMQTRMVAGDGFMATVSGFRMVRAPPAVARHFADGWYIGSVDVSWVLGVALCNVCVSLPPASAHPFLLENNSPT